MKKLRRVLWPSLLLALSFCNDRLDDGDGKQNGADENAGGSSGSLAGEAAGRGGQAAGKGGAADDGGDSAGGAFADGGEAGRSNIAGGAGAPGGSAGHDGGAASEGTWEHCGAIAPPSQCSLTETCQAAEGCDDRAPFLDGDGCLKTPCETSADCAAESMCVPRILRTGECQASVLEGCEVDPFEETCVCGTSADCEGNSYCVPIGTALCDLDGADCEVLSEWYEALSDFVASADNDEETLELAMACQKDVGEQRSELGCD